MLAFSFMVKIMVRLSKEHKMLAFAIKSQFLEPNMKAMKNLSPKEAKKLAFEIQPSLKPTKRFY